MILNLYKARALDLEPREKKKFFLGCLITVVYGAVIPLWFPEHYFNVI